MGTRSSRTGPRSVRTSSTRPAPRRSARAIAALALLLGGACAPRVAGPGAPRAEEFTSGTARFRIVYSREDARVAADVRRALEAAVPRLERWGGLRHPVTVTIHPSHEALEAAVDRPGYAWLHAWARFDTIDVQSPRTWEFELAELRRSLLGPTAQDLSDLFTHELTHCLMYQRAGGELTWMYQEIPRWFSEGLATYTAGQGRRYASLAELHAYYVEGAGAGGRPPAALAAAPRFGDPIVDPDPIYQDQWRIVYGASHQATAFLVARYGERKLVDLLRAMGTGLRFPAAFRQVMGIRDAEFAADFRRYVIWQGWRRD